MERSFRINWGVVLCFNALLSGLFVKCMTFLLAVCEVTSLPSISNIPNRFFSGGQATFYINQDKIQQHVMNGGDEENPEKYIVYRKWYRVPLCFFRK